MASTRKVRVSVDHDVCVGSAVCTRRAPGLLALNKNRQSEPVVPETDDWERVLLAAENCPVSAITVVDADTDEQIFPEGG